MKKSKYTKEQIAFALRAILDDRTLGDAIRDGFSGDEDPSREAV